MKHLPIKNPSFEYIERGFRQWLDVQGFAPTTVYALPNHLREFLYYLETAHQISQVRQIEAKHFKEYYQGLSMRSNTRKAGALSNAYLNKHLDALSKFSQYLRKTTRLDLPFFSLRRNKQDSKTIEIVSLEEIKALFSATDIHVPGTIYDAIASRDKAQLVCLYSCGLRRNECYHLDLGDINFDRNILHVRKGKNYKERFVPFSEKSKKVLQTYIYDHRPFFKLSGNLNALFLSAQGKRMGYLSMSLRLKSLIDKTELIDLKEKNVTLHTLRHSIATHLLESGMDLEKISRFLGHSSLESTQIYTHILEKDKKTHYENF
ncbi:MAG: tyrosine-type recombinase/integrase [Bacteroidetes bacterium]|nr:tyrosine-type recombinase/integrase [Bacteroidota bacterium]